MQPCGPFVLPSTDAGACHRTALYRRVDYIFGADGLYLLHVCLAGNGSVVRSVDMRHICRRAPCPARFWFWVAHRWHPHQCSGFGTTDHDRDFSTHLQPHRDPRPLPDTKRFPSSQFPASQHRRQGDCHPIVTQSSKPTPLKIVVQYIPLPLVLGPWSLVLGGRTARRWDPSWPFGAKSPVYRGPGQKIDCEGSPQWGTIWSLQG